MQRDDTNQKTVASYEGHVQEYVDGTPHESTADFKEWIDRALSYAPKGSTILELGSAFGRDADYMESEGYHVERTDVTQGFVDLLRSKGKEARRLNALTDDLGGPWAMVFANAVLLHFTPEEAGAVLVKVYASLGPKGTFAFSVKQGDGAGWSDEKLGAPRYFTYWRPAALHTLLEAANFKVIELSPEDDPEAKWLRVIATK